MKWLVMTVLVIAILPIVTAAWLISAIQVAAG